MALLVRLDHCVIHVSNWDVSNAFYRDVVGAELVETGGRLAYRFGDQQLNLHGPGVSTAQVARLPVQPGNSDLCFASSRTRSVRPVRGVAVAARGGGGTHGCALDVEGSAREPRLGALAVTGWRVPARAAHAAPGLPRRRSLLFAQSSSRHVPACGAPAQTEPASCDIAAEVVLAMGMRALTVVPVSGALATVR